MRSQPDVITPASDLTLIINIKLKYFSKKIGHILKIVDFSKRHQYSLSPNESDYERFQIRGFQCLLVILIVT